jgi:pyruvate carboxylase
VRTAASMEVHGLAERQQRVHLPVHLHVHVTPATAVAARRAPVRYVTPPHRSLPDLDTQCDL